MSATARLLRPASQFTPRSISGLALWLDGSDASSLYTTDAGSVTAVASPLDIATPALWLDASDAASITESGGLVSQWNDKSGNGRHATASSTARPTTGTRTVGGRNALDFNGTSNSMATGGSAFPTAATHTVFLVYQLDSASQSRTSVLLTAATIVDQEIRIAGFGSTAIQYVFNNNLGTTMASTAIGLGPIVFSAREATASMRSAGAGVVSTTSGSAFAWSSGSMLIGSRTAGNYVDGLLCEVIIYPTTLTDSQTASVEAYLAAKWGISGVHTTATSAGDPVGYWRDKSGNARNATQSTAASRPTITTVNGRKALAFDGSNGWMKTDRTAYAARSVFAVFRRTATVSQATYKGPFAKQAGTTDAAYGGTASASAQTGGWIAASSGGNNRLYWNNAALTASYHNGASISAADSANYLVGFPAPIDTTTPAIVYAEVAGEASGNQCWFVGTEPYSTARKYPADFCEALIYSRALTSTERRRVEQYLATRWGIALAPQVSDPDAQDWVNCVYAAGSTVSTPAASAVNDFVVGCKADGIWAAMKSVVILAGADTLAGALAPLKGTAPTSVNFSSGQYSKTTGLLGNETAYLNSNRANNADPQDNNHLAVFVVSPGAVVSRSYIGMVATTERRLTKTSGGSTHYLNNDANTGASASYPSNNTLLGMSRSAAASYTVRINGANVSRVSASSGVSSLNVFVFATNTNGTATSITDSRIGFYSIGEALDLALLDARVSALMTTLGSL